MSDQAEPNGIVGFLPWVGLSGPVDVGPFRFHPVDLQCPSIPGGDHINSQFQRMLSSYRDRKGEPIQSCTVVVSLCEPRPWHIEYEKHSDVLIAARILALSVLSNQRFYEQLAPMINATMFHVVMQGMEIGPEALSLPIRRRGLSSRTVGLTYDRVIFQQPLQIDYTEFKTAVPSGILAALENARSAQSPVWNAIESSLGFFLRGHADDQDLTNDDCVLLSAIAFERLLCPTHSDALNFAKSFAAIWISSENILLNETTNIKPDPKFAEVQSQWPIRKKWAKELYEARSSVAHRGPRDDRSTHWSSEQHLVAAAFAYPLVVKLKLATEGFYFLSDADLGACDAFDTLLRSGWELENEFFPKWPNILADYESRRQLQKIIEESWRASQDSDGDA